MVRPRRGGPRAWPHGVRGFLVTGSPFGSSPVSCRVRGGEGGLWPAGCRLARPAGTPQPHAERHDHQVGQQQAEHQEREGDVQLESGAQHECGERGNGTGIDTQGGQRANVPSARIAAAYKSPNMARAIHETAKIPPLTLLSASNAATYPAFRPAGPSAQAPAETANMATPARAQPLARSCENVPVTMATAVRSSRNAATSRSREVASRRLPAAWRIASRGSSGMPGSIAVWTRAAITPPIAATEPARCRARLRTDPSLFGPSLSMIIISWC